MPVNSETRYERRLVNSLDSMEGLIQLNKVKPRGFLKATTLGRLIHAVYPGVLAALVVALAASWLSQSYNAPVMLFALLIGMSFHFLHVEGRCVAGIEFASRQILRDVRVYKIRPAGLEIHKGIANIGFAFPQGLHFGTVEDEPCLHLFKDVIIVGGRAVLRDNLVGCRFRVLGLLRFLFRMNHNLSFYLMPRLMERTRSTPSGNTQPPGRNPSFRESSMTCTFTGTGDSVEFEAC